MLIVAARRAWRRSTPATADRRIAHGTSAWSLIAGWKRSPLACVRS